jgi:undecaprenyl-diphosphatase
MNVKGKLDSAFWISTVAFVSLSAAAGTRLLHPIDVRLLHVAQSRASETLDAAAAVFSVPGTLEYVGIALLVLVAALWLAGRRVLAGSLLAAFVVSGLLEFAMKLWVPQTPVPEEAARSADPTPILEVSYPYPYPSGHMLRSVILLGAVFVLWPNRIGRVAILTVLLGVAASRVYLGVHWTSDVIGGALLGVAALAWVFRQEASGLRHQQEHLKPDA